MSNLVSIIIPTYNRARLIERAIDSIENQGFSDYELLIVDDRSTDNSKEIIESRIAKNPRIRYLYNERLKGCSGARNFGMDQAKGEFIAFLDSDDEWADGHLATGIQALQEHKQADLFFGNRINVDLDTKEELLNYFEYVGAPESLQPEKCLGDYHFIRQGLVKGLIRGNLVSIETSILRSGWLGDFRFDESLLVSGDRDFFLRISLRSNALAILWTGISSYAYVHAASLSNPTFENHVKHLENHIFSYLRILSGEYSLNREDRQLIESELAEKYRSMPYYMRHAGMFREAIKAALANFKRTSVPDALIELVKTAVFWLRQLITSRVAK